MEGGAERGIAQGGEGRVADCHDVERGRARRQRGGQAAGAAGGIDEGRVAGGGRRRQGADILGAVEDRLGDLESGNAQVNERRAADFGTPGMQDRAVRRVETAQGAVTAPHILLACNGYLCGLEGSVAAHVMPINNFIIATEPLDDPAALIRDDVAVCDSRFVVDYFRLSRDGRLLFGGGESYGYRFPADIAAKVRRPMSRIFPRLASARIEYAWGGTLAITMDRLPHFARPAPGILSVSGYSGHGVGMATLAGKLAAEAVAGQAERFDILATIPRPRFPGGAALRTPLLTLAMLWYGLRDRL